MDITRNLKQTIVYWGSPTPDGYGGRTFDTAVELDGRWQDTQELFIDDKGNEIRSQAVVYLSQTVDLGGYLYLGALDDLDSDPDPQDIADAKEIRSVMASSDLKNQYTLYKIWL